MTRAEHRGTSLTGRAYGQTADVPEHARRAIASVEVTTHEVERSGTKGAKNRTTVVLARTTKIKFWDKLKAIEQIARLAGYLKEESTEGGTYILRWADD